MFSGSEMHHKLIKYTTDKKISYVNSKISRPTFLTTNGGRSSAGNTSLSLRQMLCERLTSVGETDLERDNDETVGRPYDLLRCPNIGDLYNHNSCIHSLIW